jgi:lipoate-protein ligase A
MKLIKYESHTPEENIALDEYMLSRAEQGHLGETIRFWESGEYFVVTGRSGKVRDECFRQLCREEGIKIIRRISGGGTVLQGPGCLNYSLVLSYARARALEKINSSYRFILEELIKGFADKGIKADYLPVSDMAVEDKKFSGNAQARKKKYFLHHGTVLYDFALNKIPRYLRHPPREPRYRKRRPHELFLCNIQLNRKVIEFIIKKPFLGKSSWYELSEADKKEVLFLVNEKYSSDHWNYVF